MPTNPTRGISNRPMQRSDYGLPEDKFVFCGFNNITKLNPGSFSAWMKILTAVPNSVIWLSPAPYRAAQNIHNFARKLGVDSNRIIFSNREDKSEDHLARQRLADLFLDSFPHNAHATSCDALWAGLPILTRIGQGYAARVAASLLNAVGMPEMVTTTTDDFINKAICIANTPGESERLKAKLAQNLLSMPLFNTERYARNLEKAYTIMMERYQNGEAPSAINI
jgi:predicted O-linked N-acetylglucosamine transferase (SPINDLY family)